MSDSIPSTIKSLLELLPSRTKGPGLIISLTSMIVAALLTKPMLPALIEANQYGWACALVISIMVFGAFLTWTFSPRGDGSPENQ